MHFQYGCEREWLTIVESRTGLTHKPKLYIIQHDIRAFEIKL
jgi:hypothetical protein